MPQVKFLERKGSYETIGHCFQRLLQQLLRSRRWHNACALVEPKGNTMAQNAQEAYEQGYADGLSMAEQMRWQGTPIGTLLKGSRYRPAQDYRGAYNAGFKHAMTASHRIEWVPPADEESAYQKAGFLSSSHGLLH